MVTVAIYSNIWAQNPYSSWDIFKYSGPGLKQIGWLATRHSSEIKSSTWSVGCETLDRDQANFSLFKNYVGELGVKHARIQSGWAKCEKEKGKYNFAWLDNIVYGLSGQSVKPWVCLCYGNPIYKVVGKDDRDINVQISDIIGNEETKNGWLNYVQALVSRYKDVVNEWEVWNEVNLNFATPEIYVPFLIMTSEAIKEVQPNAKIIGFAFAHFPFEYAKKSFEILKAENKLDVIDYVTYHPYALNPDDSYPDYEKFKALIHSYNPKLKLMQGENGCPAQLEYAFALSKYPWTEISQAKWAMRRLAGDKIRNIPSSYFCLIDLHYDIMLNTKGLIKSNLKHQIIWKRPSYYGYQHLASFFDDTVEPAGELEYSSNVYRKLTLGGFKKENKTAVLTWYKDQIPGNEMKWDLVNLTIKNTNFEDPVYVEIISGKVFEIGTSDWKNTGDDVTFKNLPVWDSPIMIAERSIVPAKMNNDD